MVASHPSRGINPSTTLDSGLALCHKMLADEQANQAIPKSDYDLLVGNSDGLWCNATFDGWLCWPATRANSSTIQQCPRDAGNFIDPQKTVKKFCDEFGYWSNLGKPDDGNPAQPFGYTDYLNQCLPADLDLVGMMMGQEVAGRARVVEFIGLALSFVSLLVAIIIFTRFRKLRVFRNQIHLQLMIAIFIVVVIRLILYVDQWFTNNRITESKTINESKYVCECFYLLLEYAKTVAFAWMFIEGFYLHHILVWSVFQTQPKLWKYCLIGWGIPVFHVAAWLTVVVMLRGISNVERCFGMYYINPEYWILDAVRLGELLLNLLFLLNIVRVLWLKMMDSNVPGESAQAKKSVRAALMLLPLLGIPNILQTMTIKPTKANIHLFAAFTYSGSFFYMYQGFFVAVIYCFTNQEVVGVLKLHWERYRLRHRSAEFFRRGSRAPPAFGHNSIQDSKNCSSVSPHTPLQNGYSQAQRDSVSGARTLLTSPEIDRSNAKDNLDARVSFNSTPASPHSNTLHDVPITVGYQYRPGVANGGVRKLHEELPLLVEKEAEGNVML